jgi:uncharacterized membrane protein
LLDIDCTTKSFICLQISFLGISKTTIFKITISKTTIFNALVGYYCAQQARMYVFQFLFLLVPVKNAPIFFLKIL